VSAAVSVVAIGVGAFSIATPAHAAEPWEIKTFTSHTTDEAEAPYTPAGAHPFANRTLFDLPNVNGAPVELLKDASVTLEPGFLGNPAALPRCPIGDLGSGNPPGSGSIPATCPPGSQVGSARVALGEPTPGPLAAPIYNLVTERGHPAQFGFIINGFLSVLSVTPLPRSEAYGLTIGSRSVPTISKVWSVETTFCAYGGEGPPYPGSHSCKAPSGSAEAPFLSNPLDCSEADPTWKLLADSWENAGTYTAGGLPDLADPNWKTASTTSPPVTGCDGPLLASQFDSTTIATKPLQPGAGPVQADSPTGLAVDLDFPQTNDPTNLNQGIDNTLPQTPEPKDITVKLPAGLSVSPSSADGLGACSDLASDPAGDQVHYDTTKPVTCPDSSKIGSAVATSPLLAAHDPQDDSVVGPEPIPGDVYLLAPHPGDLPVGGGNQVG
jgi:hypothetical protein